MSKLLPPSASPSVFLHRLQRLRQAALKNSESLLLCVAGQ
jgi:hypothetical protein